MSGSESVLRGYVEIQEDFDRTRSEDWSDFVWIKALLPKNAKILDLGCGNGRFFNALTEYQDISYTGIDSNTFFIQQARARYSDDNRHPRFMVGDMQEVLDSLLTDRASFDVICLVASFHHLMSVEARLRVLAAAYELLEPGGRIILLNWNLWRWSLRRKGVWRYAWQYLTNSTYHSLARRELNGLSWWPNEVITEWRKGQKSALLYYHAFVCGELNALLTRSGFSEVESWYSSRGVRVAMRSGENIVTIGTKPLK